MRVSLRWMGVWLLLVAFWAPSQASITCDGVDDQLTMAGVAVGTTFSLTTWFNPAAGSANYGPLLVSTSTTSKGFWWRGFGGAQYVDFSGPPGSVVSASNLPTATWHQATVVVNAGTATMYTDGVTYNTLAGYATVTWQAMCNDSAGDLFTGTLGALAIYPVALTQAEASILWTAGRLHGLGLSRQPSASWTFDQCAPGSNATTGTVFADRSGGGNGATATRGGNGTGLGCSADFSYVWGVQ